MNRVLVTSDTVKVTDLREHPSNPRRGDVDTIVASLEAHGQYRPIVAQRTTRHILAGNHTWKAAKRLGWQHVAVTWVDVDDETAARILIADNRASDLATYDDGRLAELLRTLPDLDGTGFDRHDLDRLEGVFDRPTGSPSGAEPGTKPPADLPPIRIGRFILLMSAPDFVRWRDEFGGDRKPRAVIADLRARLGLTEPTPGPVTATERPTVGVDHVDITTLHPYPANARQGDIGAISESLRHLGQYRPIVANRRDNIILVGNHTWQAAKMLGWSHIAVAWVDVDDTEAAKIVAVDNRTSDLATYDDETLGLLLSTVTNLDGTGYTLSDVDDLLADTVNGTPHRRPARTSNVSCTVGQWSWRVTRDTWDRWENGLRPEIDDGTIHSWIADTLGISDNDWTGDTV